MDIPFETVQYVQQLDVKATHARGVELFNLLAEAGGVKGKHAIQFYVDVRNSNLANAQQITAFCMFCRAKVPSTGSYKLVNHLITCALCPQQIRQGFKSIREETGKKRAQKRDIKDMAEQEAALMNQERSVEQALLKQQGIRQGFKTSAARSADLAIADFFYANAIPFFAASCEQTSPFRVMVQAIQNAPLGYIPPNHLKLANELLDESYNRMLKQIEARDADGALKEKFGATYMSDGWDSCDALPLINSAFVTANDGGMFWRSVNTSSKTKYMQYNGKSLGDRRK
ncbi:hypothetical protein AB1Y20_000546 [Prymnesium parvum]|uniref:Uncharacterized protein n=1 Tax=Prymnesium parvum TaxID=97485 RepID=A0AB34K8S6_PRYPA